MAKDVNWKLAGGGQGWQDMSGTIADLVARQIAAGKDKKKKKKDKKKKKK